MLTLPKYLIVLVTVSPIFFTGCSSWKSEIPESKTQPVSSQQVDKNQAGNTIGVKQESSVKSQLNRTFLGIWLAEGSSAVFTIAVKNGVVMFSGEDREDHERFNISFIDWDEQSFSSLFYMPSTRHSTKVKLSIVDDDTLHCEYGGDAVGETIWLREK